MGRMYSVKLTKDGSDMWLDYVNASTKSEAKKNAEQYVGKGWKAVSCFVHKK